MVAHSIAAVFPAFLVGVYLIARAGPTITRPFLSCPLLSLAFARCPVEPYSDAVSVLNRINTERQLISPLFHWPARSSSFNKGLVHILMSGCRRLR